MKRFISPMFFTDITLIFVLIIFCVISPFIPFTRNNQPQLAFAVFLMIPTVLFLVPTIVEYAVKKDVTRKKIGIFKYISMVFFLFAGLFYPLIVATTSISALIICSMAAVIIIIFYILGFIFTATYKPAEEIDENNQTILLNEGATPVKEKKIFVIKFIMEMLLVAAMVFGSFVLPFLIFVSDINWGLSLIIFTPVHYAAIFFAAISVMEFKEKQLKAKKVIGTFKYWLMLFMFLVCLYMAIILPQPSGAAATALLACGIVVYTLYILGFALTVTRVIYKPKQKVVGQ